MKKELFKRIGIISIVALIVIYVTITLVNSNLNNANELKTEIALKYTYSENIITDAFIVRNETLITNNTKGVEYYMVNDGEKVSVNSIVAKVFPSETDALFYNKIQDIDEKISVLESLNTPYDNAITDSAVDGQIYLNLSNMISQVNNVNFDEVEESVDSLVYSVNQRQRIVGTVSSFDNEIAELQNEKNKYIQTSADCLSEIKAPVAGYFVANTDGYENIYDYSKVLDITTEFFNTQIQPQPCPENTIGKIVSGLDWYVVCKLNADDALALSHSTSSPKIIFNSISDEPIPTQLAALNQTSKQSDAVAVFKCNYMNDSLSGLRNESVQILINNYEGVRITKSALHDSVVDVVDPQSGEKTGEKKKVQGVFIRHGNELLFREVSVIFAGNDFIIVDINPAEGTLKSGKTIIINDEIIIDGDNLYDGKVVK